MSKTEQLSALFKEWRSSNSLYGDSFAEDGIVNEDLWDKAAKKILFLLKDTNGYKGDFRGAVDSIPWPEIGYWSYGLEHSLNSSFPDFSIAADQYRDACRGVAVVNIKKSPGKGSADAKEIERFATRDREFIEKEIGIISPDIIVSGGVFDICKGIWGSAEKISERVYKFSRFRDSIFIDFVHPRVRVATDVPYYALMVVYQKFLNRV